MKNNIKKTLIKTAAVAFLFAVFAGCGEMLDNPLKDKGTGKDINLLILDFNFFNTRMTYKLFDASDNSVITAPATITFTGKNANDIVTFTGEKRPEFTTTKGQMELTIDPNVTISESTPFEFAVNVEVDGFNKLSKGIQFQNEGKKTIELYLTKTTNEDETNLGGDIHIGDGDTTIIFYAPNTHQLKSAAVVDKPYIINYAITINDFLKFKDANGDYLFQSSAEVLAAYDNDPDNFVSLSFSTSTDYSPGIDVINDGGNKKSLLFHKLETGKLNSILVTGREVDDLNGGVISSTCTYTGDVVPDIFGFAEFNTDSWDILGTSNQYDSLHFSYTVVEASTEPLCETGASITFSSNAISSFSIDAEVYDADSNLINIINFKGNFPETFVVENTPNKLVKLVFRDNNPSFKPIAPLEIENFCTGSYNVDVTPQDGYVEYQIALKAICPDNPTVAVAPTYSGEIKIPSSDNPWQGVDMIGGVVDLLGLPGQEYQLRLLWEDDWEYSTFYTDFDASGNYLHATDPKVSISSEKMADGRIRINVEQEFKQNVCNDMGW